MMTRTTLVQLAAVALLVACTACSAETGPVPPPTPEDNASADGGATSASALTSCRSGYHLHYIDWAATRPMAWFGGSSYYCGYPESRLLTQWSEFCQQDGGGISRCGDYWVAGYTPWNGQYSWVKIRALNGHD